MPRCFSKCRGVKEEDCKEPCSFIAKKYCRLSSQYKMEPPGCEVVKKKSSIVPKRSTPNPQPKIPSPVLPKTYVKTKKTVVKVQTIKSAKTKPLKSPVKTKKTLVKVQTKPVKTTRKTVTIKAPTIWPPITLRNKTPNKSRVTRTWSLKKYHPKEFASKTIQTFMKKTEGKRKALFLQEMCADSGTCLTFGKEKDKLMKFFQFDQFTYATFPTKTIGEPSGNGFVKEIRYEREKYHAYAVLKSSKDRNADNLAYEYLVGKYINVQAKRFPVFLDTYGLFTYKDSLNRETLLKKNEVTSQLTPLDPMDIANVCRKTSTECILIQHFKEVTPLYKMASSMTFFVYESPYVFYNIFFALHQLRNEFTHYDLHNANVLLFEPVKGKYLEYHYHLPNETVVFHSIYIAKIIDYGRSFFPGAPDYYKKLMAEPECKSGKGLKHAFGYLRKERNMDDIKYFVNPYYKNESHDLKLLNGFRTLIDMSKMNEARMLPYIDMFKKLVYENTKYPHIAKYGTKENLTHDDKVRNVTDVEERLRQWILDKENIRANQAQFKASNKLGEFHIYSDGKDMEYKPV
jgi:hypothetical protein